MNGNCNKLTRKWLAKKPKWRAFNVKLTKTMFNDICNIVTNEHSASIAEFIRLAVIEKTEEISMFLEMKRKEESLPLSYWVIG